MCVHLERERVSELTVLEIIGSVCVCERERESKREREGSNPINI